jgi:iron complex transport system substrate-binding protein
MVSHDESITTRASTRRQYLAHAGVLASGVALAGCSGSGGSADDGESAGGDSVSVTMAPVGTVTFDSVPERWSTYFPDYADMGIALGQADGLTAVGSSKRFHTGYLDELGIATSFENVAELYSDTGIDPEIYYELGNDVHLTDPKWLSNTSAFGLEEKDIEKISSTVGPFVGNAIFRQTDKWHDYEYYTLYEAFEAIATLFDQRDRFEALKSIHDGVVSTVEAGLPPEEKRPEAVLAFAGTEDPTTFSPYRLKDKGTNKKHLRDLGIRDALAGSGIEGLSSSNRGEIDLEVLLDVDPDLLLLRGHEEKSAAQFDSTVGSYLKNHPVASDLTAVENGDVYRGGPIYLGPVQHLFVLERLATAIYPDQFSGALFDRDRVAQIITNGP